ncbi:MAG: hypothetical protein ABI867_43305, partial [Kofleriaceae bacterium]
DKSGEGRTRSSAEGDAKVVDNPASTSLAMPVTKKPRRLGIVVAIAGIAIAGTVTAAVVITSSKDTPVARTPDAAVATAVVTTPDAAPAVAPPVIADAAVAPVDANIDDGGKAGFRTATHRPLRDRQSPIAVDRTTNVEVCIDETGTVVKVLPESLNAKLRREITILWHYAPYRERPQDASLAVCFPVKLEPLPSPVATVVPDRRDVDASGSASRATPPPPPPLADKLTAGEILARVEPKRFMIEGACKRDLDGEFSVKLQLLAAGALLAGPVGATPPNFVACVQAQLGLIKWPKTKFGGAATMTFKFGGNSGGYGNRGY